MGNIGLTLHQLTVGRSILVVIFPINLDLTDLREILLDGPSRFGQATLNESVSSIGR